MPAIEMKSSIYSFPQTYSVESAVDKPIGIPLKLITIQQIDRL